MFRCEPYTEYLYVVSVSLDENRKDWAELRTELQKIRKELENNFVDTDNTLHPDDRYADVMWPFVAEASERVESLGDKLRLTEAEFSHVKELFAVEAHKQCSSVEFFGIFKEFVTSYKVKYTNVTLDLALPETHSVRLQKAKQDNATIASERAAREKRKRVRLRNSPFLTSLDFPLIVGRSFPGCVHS
jgi:cytokinesis protein